jgi:hypothetical protein
MILVESEVTGIQNGNWLTLPVTGTAEAQSTKDKTTIIMAEKLLHHW